MTLDDDITSTHYRTNLSRKRTWITILGMKNPTHATPHPPSLTFLLRKFTLVRDPGSISQWTVLCVSHLWRSSATCPFCILRHMRDRPALLSLQDKKTIKQPNQTKTKQHVCTYKDVPGKSIIINPIIQFLHIYAFSSLVKLLLFSTQVHLFWFVILVIILHVWCLHLDCTI